MMASKMVPELSNEPKDLLRRLHMLEEQLIGEEVEDEKDAGLIVRQGVNKIDEVLDRSFFIRIILLIQHLPRELEKEDDYLQFIEIHKPSPMLIDEVDQHEHALLRGDSDQLIAFLADP